ncbi:MAG: beta-ketoacyl-ACP synthase II [Polyangiales bacterium]
MRRVVVTGVGVVSPCGLDAASTWENVVAGKSGIAPIAGFDADGFATRFAGECTGFNAEAYIEKRRLREGDRFIHLAVAASAMAIEQAGVDAWSAAAKEKVGTFIGVGMCGLDLLERSARVLAERGPRKITPYFIPSVIANLAPGQVSMRHGLRGPSFTTTSACSSGAHALGEALRWIQRGDIVAAVAGGAEAAVTGLGVGGFNAMRALSQRNDAPEAASRPFDKDRDGFVIAEGAGILMLEERDHAIARGAEIFAEFVGYGATADAYHLTQPAPEGEGAQRAMRACLADAGVSIDQVDYVNAHATSTPTGDVQESIAIRSVFHGHPKGTPLVSSTKSMTGHLLGAAGGLEAVLSVLSVHHQIVPPTINVDNLDPACAGLQLVTRDARRHPVKVAISNAFGFGGTNVTLAFCAHDRA